MTVQESAESAKFRLNKQDLLLRPASSALVTYSNTVRPGDHFNASVTYRGNNGYSLFISDANGSAIGNAGG